MMGRVALRPAEGGPGPGSRYYGSSKLKLPATAQGPSQLSGRGVNCQCPPTRQALDRGRRPASFESEFRKLGRQLIGSLSRSYAGGCLRLRRRLPQEASSSPCAASASVSGGCGSARHGTQASIYPGNAEAGIRVMIIMMILMLHLSDSPGHSVDSEAQAPLEVACARSRRWLTLDSRRVQCSVEFLVS
jgi:hypothetical protein